MKIAIITATYNREKHIQRLFDSLRKQNNKSFTWIIVDDGSTDQTEQIINDMKKNSQFEIRYFKKNNEGKAIALNYGFKNNSDIDFFAVVDSDDWLAENAVDIIIDKANFYFDTKIIGAIFFKYLSPNGEKLHNQLKKNDKSSNYLNEEKIMTRYEHDSYYIKEDGCIGYYSRAVKKYKYPKFGNEKYLGPIVIQMLMADEYKIVFTIDNIGFAQYLEDGISKSGRKLRLKNPYGMIFYCGLLQSNKNKNLYSRIKYCIEAQAYSFVSNINKNELKDTGILPSTLKTWARIPGMILGLIWKEKYSNTKNIGD